MGSNMAECHPVGFQWVMEAKRRGAEVIHVDPRFTRTSAVASSHVQLRAGSDLAFLGGIVHHILENGRDFREYVLEYTNAPVIVDDRFLDTEDLDGLFSGWDPEKKTYDTTTWQYEGMEVAASAGQRELGATAGEQAGHGGHGSTLHHGEPPSEDPTLEHPRCVYQLLRKHFRRYTPEFVEQTCGVPRDQFLRVADALCDNSGRERTSAIVYSVGWTQHTVGVQYIRAAAIVQLLLGNIGRPGGGILALRGHASIQGSTDIPTLYNILPGYIPMPHVHAHQDLRAFVESNAAPGGFWGNMEAYTVSLLKAYWGDNATAENDYCFDYLPRISGDHSIYASVLGMLDGTVDGMIVAGQNPAVGSANSRLHRFAMAELDWLVVRDLFEVETASFWKDGPEIERGELRTEDIGTEVFFMPAAAHTEKDGSFTNTQRLLQWHHKAVEPPGDCRSELWFYYHLGRIIREKLAGSTRRRSTVPCSICSGTTRPRARSPSRAPRPCSARSTAAAPTASSPPTPTSRRTAPPRAAAGSTAACSPTRPTRPPAACPGSEQTWVAPEWGWAWPANRRILYNRASADPEGRPWSQRKRYVWWDEREQKWTGDDVPDFEPAKRPDYVPPDGAKAQDVIAGNHPFIMQADGRAWLYAPAGLVDGPLPDPLRTGGVAVPERALRPAVESGSPAVSAPGQRVQRRRRPLPVRLHHVPPHRAPHRRRHEPHARVPVRAAAGHVLRGQPAAGGRTRPGAGRLGDRAHPPLRDRGARARDRSPAAAAGAGPDRAPGGAALPLGLARAQHRRRRQRPGRDHARPERAHPGGEGGHLRRPPGPAAAGHRRW